jgi:NitT/TauT family transport system permease protein/taurine transport system permease protein
LAIIAVIFLAAVNPMILTIIEGVLQIQGTEIKAARVLGARRWQLFVYVYLPASLPFITAALRIGFSQAWRALVAAEMVGAVAGIGWSVRINSEVGNNEEMILYIVMIGFLSWLFERLLFRPLEKHYEVWRLA